MFGPVGWSGGALRLLLIVVLWLALVGVPAAPATAHDESDLAPGWVLVKLRDPSRPIPVQTARSLYGALGIEPMTRLELQRWRVPVGTEKLIVRRLMASGHVEYAEVDRILRLGATPDDPLYATHQWYLDRINAPSAWDVTRGSPTVIVAVIDSGFDVAHPDGPVNLHLGCDYVRWRAASFADVCPPVLDDPHGHGTHVAGIVAARQNNALGVTGVAPGVGLLVIRTADAAGLSYMSDVAEGVVEAADAGARVVNLSLGGPTASTTLRIAVEDAVARDVLVVAASGNGFQDGNPTLYPAGYAGVLAVGAVTALDEHADYSSTGAHLGIVAPVGDGADVLPQHWTVSLLPMSRGGYGLKVGTSMAAPQVAGAAGLILSLRPALGGTEVADVLRSTAQPLGGAVPNATYGYGRLDLRAALATVGASTPPTPAPSPTPTAQPPPPSDPTAPTSGQPRLLLPFAPKSTG
jgi:subtilisin family serine protease